MEQKWRGGGGREKKGEESRRGEEEDATAEDKRGKGKRSVASAMWMKVSNRREANLLARFDCRLNLILLHPRDSNFRPRRFRREISVG